MTACAHARCGEPQQGAGRPRNGWVRVSITGSPPALWFCGPAHAAAALAPSAGRLDVATCPACVARHDLDHACRSCGHRPPVRLYRWSPDAGCTTTIADEQASSSEVLATAGATAADVRAWALCTGAKCSENGPLPRVLVDAFVAAHEGQAS